GGFGRGFDCDEFHRRLGLFPGFGPAPCHVEFHADGATLESPEHNRPPDRGKEQHGEGQPFRLVLQYSRQRRLAPGDRLPRRRPDRRRAVASVQTGGWRRVERGSDPGDLDGNGQHPGVGLRRNRRHSRSLFSGLFDYCEVRAGRSVMRTIWLLLSAAWLASAKLETDTLTVTARTQTRTAQADLVDVSLTVSATDTFDLDSVLKALTPTGVTERNLTVVRNG